MRTKDGSSELQRAGWPPRGLLPSGQVCWGNPDTAQEVMNRVAALLQLTSGPAWGHPGQQGAHTASSCASAQGRRIHRRLRGRPLSASSPASCGALSGRVLP